MTNDKQALLDDFLEAAKRLAKVEVVSVQEDVSYETESGRAGMDAKVQVRLPGGDECSLAVEVLRYGYPRDVRLAVERLHQCEMAAEDMGSVQSVIVADTLSPGSRKALRQAGFSFFDSSGTLHFHKGNVLVDVDRAPEDRRPRVVGSLFTSAREQVAHALLHHWASTEGREFITGGELAAKSETSPYTVSLVMQEMEHQDWVQSQGSGPLKRRRLRDAAALLGAWAEAWKARKENRSRWFAFVPRRGGPLDYVLEQLAGQEDWAVTGAAAANTIRPHLTQVDRVDLVVKPGRTEEIAKRLKLGPAERGSNIVIVERAGASWMFMDGHPERPGSKFVSRFIQYLDLLNGVGRNKELAREYRRAVLKIEEEEEE
jgi:hypothetical protein